jgi:hypothetical protein
MVFNATFNDISIISWWSVLSVEKTGASREKHKFSEIQLCGKRGVNREKGGPDVE